LSLGYNFAAPSLGNFQIQRPLTLTRRQGLRLQLNQETEDIFMSEKVYSVGQLSQLAGVTPRTLHHYDQIGLLVPKRDANNGYREYSEKDLIRLQQIIIYRELDFSSHDIKQFLQQGDEDSLLKALTNQKKVLGQRRQQMDSMIASLDNSIDVINGKSNQAILLQDLPKLKIEQWNEEILDQQGQAALDQWLTTIGKLPKNVVEYERRQSLDFIAEFKQVMHLAASDQSVQDATELHYLLLNRFLYRTQAEFGGISDQGYQIFAQNIIDDPTAFALFEHFQPGMSSALAQAMRHFAKHRLHDELESLRLSGKEFAQTRIVSLA